MMFSEIIFTINVNYCVALFPSFLYGYFHEGLHVIMIIKLVYIVAASRYTW